MRLNDTNLEIDATGNMPKRPEERDVGAVGLRRSVSGNDGRNYGTEYGDI